MKAMILAAGRGTRMLPLTNNVPKPLVKLGDQYLIEYTLNNLKAAGINDIVINIHHLASEIKSTLKHGAKWGMNIEYSEELELLDTGGGIVAAIQKNLIGNEPFIVVSADIITKFNFSSLINKLTKLAHLILVPNPAFKPQGDFSLKDNILALADQKHNNNYTYGNIGIFDPKFFAGTHEKIFPLLKLIQKHLNNQQITAEIYPELWQNIGTIQDIELMQNNILNNHYN